MLMRKNSSTDNLMGFKLRSLIGGESRVINIAYFHFLLYFLIYLLISYEASIFEDTIHE